MFLKKSRIQSKRASIFDVEDTYSVPTAKLQNIFLWQHHVELLFMRRQEKSGG